MADSARRAVEGVVRSSYGRLVSYLSARSGDVAGAEDALSEALLTALRVWPAQGVPDKPEAWLLSAARRKLVDRVRQQRVRQASSGALQRALEEAEELACDSAFPDERLTLMLVCAHPAIDPTLHTPLMLQAVLGLSAVAIGKAFLTLPATMGQRLARAKAKIREAGITFGVPHESELPQRIEAVLQAIYAAYGVSWEDYAGTDAGRRGLSEEALWLARVCCACLPREPEALGLLALLLHCEARHGARRTPNGDYVPIVEQDTARWSRPMIAEAERLLTAASRERRIGRFQLEAAIQSAHVERMRGNPVDWSAVALLYRGLVQIAPTLGAVVGEAAALGQARGPEEGLQRLEQIAPELVRDYQPYWAVRAHLSRLAARTAAAQEAYQRAIALSEDPAVRQFLAQHVP